MLGPAGWERLFGRGEEVREIRTKMWQGEKWIWTGAEWVALVCSNVFKIVLGPNDGRVGGRGPACVCAFAGGVENETN